MPSWSAYALMTKLCDGEPVFVTCPQNNGFKPRAEDIDAAITPKTKWLILNNPNNPDRRLLLGCGAARDRRCDGEASACLDHVGRHVRAPGVRRLQACDDRRRWRPNCATARVTVSGASKAYAMTGWRIGYAGGPKNLIRAMVNMQGQATAGVSTVGQAAAAAALDGPQDGVAEQIVAYRNRRDMAVEMLNACQGINCHKPEGAFYVFPNVAGCIGRTTAGGRKLDNRSGRVHGAARGGACRDGARRGVRHEPVSARQHGDGRRIAGRGLPPHRQVLRRAALTASWSIRPGRDADATGFIALIARLLGGIPRHHARRRWRDAGTACARHLLRRQGWRAVGGGEPTGGSSAWSAPRRTPTAPGKSAGVYAQPSPHGSGLGHALLETAEAHARAAGAARLVLWSDTRFDRAHRFYEKHGYVRHGPIRVLHDISNSLEFGYAKPVAGIEVLDAAAAASAERRLAEILCACVDAGASVSYLPPLAPDVARGFWKRMAADVAAGTRILLAAWDDADAGRHRDAGVRVLAEPAASRRGAEAAGASRRATPRRGARADGACRAEALRAGRSLLTLDTRAGDAAESVVPCHGLAGGGPHSRLCAERRSDAMRHDLLLEDHRHAVC